MDELTTAYSTGRRCIPFCSALAPTEALGWEEVQAAADLQAVQAVVDRTALETARPVRPLAVGPRVLIAGEKSPVTGDCHAGILWEPGGEIPPGDPT